MKRAITLLVVAAVVVMVAVPALAADDESPGGIDADSPFYFLQQIIEEVRLRLTENAADRAGFVAQLLELRVNEIGSMVQRGRPDIVGHLAGRTARTAGVIGGIFDQMVENGDDMDAADVVAEATLEAEKVLQDLLDEVGEDMPVEALEGLNTALEAVRNGRNQALDVLEGIANGEFPGNQEQAQGALEQLMERFGHQVSESARERLGPPFETDEGDPDSGE